MFYYPVLLLHILHPVYIFLYLIMIVYIYILSLLDTIRYILSLLYIYIYRERERERKRVFANGPGDQDSIPGRVIPKTEKMVLDAFLLNTQHYKVRIKGKVEQSREGVAPSPTPWCSSYRKGNLRVTLDYGHQLYLLIYIYIYIYIYVRMVGLKSKYSF